jgi:23S rRNA (pseudouridine1915-N3)-methyltransferase
MREIQPRRFDPWTRHPSARKIFLDPAGKPMDSAAFARLIAASELASRDVVFLIGGHDGLPPGPAFVPVSHDVSARIGPRHAGRADLPGVRHLAGPSLPALT